MSNDTFVPIHSPTFAALRCCRCLGGLEVSVSDLTCINQKCNAVYPVVGHVPVILNEQNSVFTFADFIGQRDTFFPTRSPLKRFLTGLVPRISKNVGAHARYARLLGYLVSQNANPKVLVVGGSIVGEGMQDFIGDSRLILVETDVSFGPRTAAICDAHDLPFEDEYFDCVIAQAVLEHVVDPVRCVKQIHRVLKTGGLVYADTPFMQQVHSRAYDFTRFTHLGHRRLFRNFSEVESGASCGPGMALAWAHEGFVLSFLRNSTLRKIATLAVRLSYFPLKYFDYFLVKTPGGLDAASSLFFIGRKSQTAISDSDLIKSYRGAQ